MNHFHHSSPHLPELSEPQPPWSFTIPMHQGCAAGEASPSRKSKSALAGAGAAITGAKAKAKPKVWGESFWANYTDPSLRSAKGILPKGFLALASS